jgi:hypothetical protein
MKKGRRRKNPHAVVLGRLGWVVRSVANRENGRKGWPGQKPQEDSRRAAQRPPAPARASQEILGTLIALIQARYGDVAIGLGELGIRHRAAANR